MKMIQSCLSSQKLKHLRIKMTKNLTFKRIFSRILSLTLSSKAWKIRSLAIILQASKMIKTRHQHKWVFSNLNLSEFRMPNLTSLLLLRKTHSLLLLCLSGTTSGLILHRVNSSICLILMMGVLLSTLYPRLTILRTCLVEWRAQLGLIKKARMQRSIPKISRKKQTIKDLRSYMTLAFTL